jgi:autotransporter-associated beta strand protein
MSYTGSVNLFGDTPNSGVVGVISGAGVLSLGDTSGATTINVVNGYLSGNSLLTLSGILTSNPWQLGINTNAGTSPALPISLWPSLFNSPTTTLGGTLDSGGTLTLGLPLGGPLTVLPYGGILNLGSTALGGTITGSINTIGGAGTIVLSAANTYTGAATINAATINSGTLVVNGANTVTVVGGVLQLNGNAPTLQGTGNTALLTAPAIQLSAQPNSPSDITLQANATPEPSSAVLLALGLAVPFWRARKRLVRA